MEQQNIIEKVKIFLLNSVEKLKSLSNAKKIAIGVGAIAVILATIFTATYVQKSKYDVLFSNLDPKDAASISQELESRKVDTKIEGNTIYVPKQEVDKLRLELSPTITNGSKGFELMDEGSSIGLTDEEFEIKKQRMIQGEIEKTIKSFSQVENARVHITQGEKSVFVKESTPGKAAVYITLKPGTNLTNSQVKSIVSLISGSTNDIPKENVEVVDQNMRLLSEGIFDEDKQNNSQNVANLDETKQAESKLNTQLKKSIVDMLEPMFGAGKVKVTVNTDLNFDTTETTQIKIDPEKVIKKETRSENTSTDNSNGGSLVDNNMSNTANNGAGKNQSKEETIEYEVGKTETNIISAPGEVRRITASVAIDGDLGAPITRNVEDLVSNAIGMNTARGDSISVVSMEFDPAAKAEREKELQAMEKEAQMDKLFKIGTYVIIATSVLIIILGAVLFISKRRKSKFEEDDQANMDLINAKLEELEEKKLQFIDADDEELTLEEEVKIYATEKPDQVTEIIKKWLSD